eukprot:2617351-Rhodomonas_salina.2
MAIAYEIQNQRTGASLTNLAGGAGLGLLGRGPLRECGGRGPRAGTLIRTLSSGQRVPRYAPSRRKRGERSRAEVYRSDPLAVGTRAADVSTGQRVGRA